MVFMLMMVWMNIIQVYDDMMNGIHVNEGIDECYQCLYNGIDE